MERAVVGWIAAFLIVAIVVVGVAAGFQEAGTTFHDWAAERAEGFGSPSPEEAVAEFREEGLEVGMHYHQGSADSLVPATYTEVVRFTIPSLGTDSGGRVYAFDSREDLEVVQTYYENLDRSGLFGRVWVFSSGTLLLQISGELPRSQAEEYGDVLQSM